MPANYYIYDFTNNKLKITTMHNQILKIYIQKLKYFNYCDRTIEVYMHYVEKFLVKTGKYVQHLTSSDFQEYLNTYKFSSISQQNQIISAIKFLYEKVLNKKYDKVRFERPRAEKHLPRIIDKKIILQKIENIQNIKHQAILSLGFSVGLRVSEVCNLKVTDIDSKRMLILIKNGKGKKDRLVPLTNKVLFILRKYYNNYRPKDYLFTGQFGGSYSPRSCEQLIKTYIDKTSGFHLLRHSCFTSMLESGTDIRVIQKIAGHKSLKTTQIYTHVSTNCLKTAAMPI
jgi:integrase/recombinase XerD